MLHLVVVEPDTLSGKVLRFVLSDAGHQVRLVTTAADAFPAILGQETDAVLLQTELADLDGFLLCRELRARRYYHPILFVSPRTATADKLRAFDLGADDYLTMPYDPLELLARVQTVVRRSRQRDQQSLGTLVKVGDAELSIGELTWRAPNRPPALLTPTEMRMLECLMRNANITIGRETLIERTWGYDFLGDSNRVDVYIRRIRKKIEADPTEPQYLHTVRGLGYCFRPPAWGAIMDLAPANLNTLAAVGQAQSA
jgi:two-component system, OmpR family, response regulator RegX3